jgi:hypothetical protein
VRAPRPTTGVARAAYLHFASVANQARFVIARDARQAAAEGSDGAIRTRRAMQEILEAEIARRSISSPWRGATRAWGLKHRTRPCGPGACHPVMT